MSKKYNNTSITDCSKCNKQIISFCDEEEYQKWRYNNLTIAQKRTEQYSDIYRQERINEQSVKIDKKISKTKDVDISCPKCGSTAISNGARGFSFWTGFVGSGQTVNRCGNCGNVWKPRG